MNMVRIYDRDWKVADTEGERSVDLALVHFTECIESLDKSAYHVQRWTPAQQPECLASNPVAAELVGNYGEDVLPLVFVGDGLICRAHYPDPDEFLSMLRGVATGPGGKACCGRGCCFGK